MTKEINLLPEIALSEEKQIRLKKLITICSLGLLTLCIFSVIASFSIQIYLSKEVDKLILTNNGLRENILEYKEIETEERALKSKLTAISKIRKDSRDFNLYLTKIQQLTNSDGIEIKNIGISEQFVVQLTGSASDNNSITSFIKNLTLQDSESQPLFKDVSLTSLSQSKSSEYQFSITMNINKALI